MGNIMKKIVVFLILLIFPFKVLGMTLPDLHSTNVLLYDPDTKEILYEKNANTVSKIASLTKMMTTIVAIENISDLNESIVITSEMLNEVPFDASVAGLKVGDKVTYLDLLYASLLPSGADATTALAHGICGNTQDFIKLMNQKAQDLGLINTHFNNVTGYDIEEHYSTPKEVLEILLYSLKNDLFSKIYKTKNYTLSNGLEVETTLNVYNRNNIYDLTPIIGSKTGFTSQAGLCMASIIKVVDKELILITLGAERVYGKGYNIEDALTIVNYLNNNYKNEVLFKKDDVLFSIPVKDAQIDSYEVKVQDDISIYSDKIKTEDLKYEYDGLDTLDFKNQKGDKLGTITYHYQDKTFTQDIFLEESINLSIPKYLENHKIFSIGIVLVFLFLLLMIHKTKKRKRRRRKVRK